MVRCAPGPLSALFSAPEAIRKRADVSGLPRAQAFAIYPSFRAFESSEPVTWLPDADSLSLTISGRPSHSAAAVAQDPETMSSMKELSPRLLRVIDEIKEERNARARESGAMGDLWAEVTDVIQGGDEAVKELCRTEDRVMAFGDWHE
jgi:hypothetical protein